MSKNILVVDDSYYMRTILKHMLEDAGYHVIDEAANGQDALKGVDTNREKLDLVTLDLILPDNSGLDVLKEIKAKHPDLKVMVVSAVGQQTIVDQALAIGANAYVIKPFEESKVMEIVDELMKEEDAK